jgi:hypothetical protein
MLTDFERRMVRLKHSLMRSGFGMQKHLHWVIGWHLGLSMQTETDWRLEKLMHLPKQRERLKRKRSRLVIEKRMDLNLQKDWYLHLGLSMQTETDWRLERLMHSQMQMVMLKLTRLMMGFVKHLEIGMQKDW